MATVIELRDKLSNVIETNLAHADYEVAMFVMAAENIILAFTILDEDLLPLNLPGLGVTPVMSIPLKQELYELVLEPKKKNRNKKGNNNGND
jgi:hypothetical protein